MLIPQFKIYYTCFKFCDLIFVGINILDDEFWNYPFLLFIESYFFTK
jgi:hypothetical protein